MTEDEPAEQFWNRTKDKIGILSGRMQNEQQLVGYRMQWLVMSQTFLFSGVVFGGGPKAGPLSWLALKVITLLGLIISLCAVFGVVAALRMINILYYRMEVLDGLLGLRKVGPRRESSWTTWAGNTPTLVLPAVFSGNWIMLLAAVWRWPVPAWVTLCGAVTLAVLVLTMSVVFVYRPKPDV